MRLRPALAALVLVIGGAVQAAEPEACPPEGTTREAMRELKRVGWRVDDEAGRATLALSLLPCLASADPEWRDALAFEALSAWMRKGALTVETARQIGSRMLAQLQAADEAGFARPFAALTLAEVARADRLKPLWTPEEREAVVAAASAFLGGTRDYRGFDADQGWRHAVAHGADLAMQLSLNPALAKSQLDRLLAAIATQVLPPVAHFYIYGEGERLAVPVLFIARRMLHTEGEWSAWIGRIAQGATPTEGAPFTQESLARLHDAKAFLLPLYASLQEAKDEPWRHRLLPPVVAALRALP